MKAVFEIAPNLVTIPPGWKVSWDHLNKGRSIYPELTFESLLCLTFEPDFVLDFGWCLRDNGVGDEGIRYDLQINRGHFGLSDVLVQQSWFSFEPALNNLQSWMNRLAAGKAEQVLDADLQQRLADIEARIRHIYVPPSGEPMIEPFARVLRNLIRNEPESYWLAGSGDAALQYRVRHQIVQSQLIFLYREPHGFHIEWHPNEGLALRLTNGKTASASEIVSVTLGGAPWDLPANEFVSRNMAARVITSFIEEGSGDCPSVGIWIS